MRAHLSLSLLLLSFSLVAGACVSDAGTYNAPAEPPASDADRVQQPSDVGDAITEPDSESEVDTDAASPGEPDVGPPADAQIGSDAGVEADGSSSEDGGASPADVAVEVAPGSDASGGDALGCLCRFELAFTEPMVQDYVWVTGSFLEPTWPDHADTGALPMNKVDAEGLWRLDVELPPLATVEYKFLAGWQDNPGPVWRGFDGGTPGENGLLYVLCGQTPCDVAP